MDVKPAATARLWPQTPLRARITAAYRRAETECVPALIDEASVTPAEAARVQSIARELVVALRSQDSDGLGVKALIQEYSLSSQEGVALMCLAEALLRIPDAATRDALIRDKISTANWQAHVGNSPSLFVNAATWGLLVTGKLTATSSEGGLSAAITRLIGRGGEPLIRKGVDMAMRMMGEQFVTGQTIEEALEHSRSLEAKGFRYSYDCLGEAATTAVDAQRYFDDYERAIHAIGKASDGRGVYEGPGISVKLSALHPRYSRAQFARVWAQLLPRLKSLMLLARRYDIALNIDAEETDRLEISLELLEALCFEPELAGWNGIGFVLQAYQKRCRFVVDWIIDLARRSHHRLMIRLVKGAYWDSEIKRAQVEGLDDFPVFTRKVHTDVSYLACARKLLSAPDAVYPQFATHNAQTLGAVITMAGGNFYAGQYEFQCLHGMGEPLYEQVVGKEGLNRPCRIYAPVGTHETLLAYLVRRLLENGANTSFVNRIADRAVAVDDLIADPVSVARAIAPVGAMHSKISLPNALFGDERRNSMGFDFSNEQQLAALNEALTASTPVSAAVLSLGTVADATAAEIVSAIDQASAAATRWAATSPQERAAVLWRAADLLEAQRLPLIGLIVRESGKSLPNAVAEIREAVDFLRYYGAQVRANFNNATHHALGPVVCISPWNFPLAIFVGQVAAALGAGNTVLAKPAEETPQIAATAVRLLHEAGVPTGALQYVTGAGEVGAALVADPRVCGVLFTGSTAVARLIQGQLAQRLSAAGQPIPLIAETGGQNAMIVDSSALPEQVVGDVIASAFDSAGQRCSALRVLCLQDEIAERVLTMLKGAMRELVVGDPMQLSTDLGPVITAAARDMIESHVANMQTRGHAVERLSLSTATANGTFVAPTIIEINRLSDVEREVFGPVLHVLRFKRAALNELIDDINATGYGLTFGLHTRIDETIAIVTRRIAAGNLYVNRNVIGAVVGVQPFGGHGLSGTGPKAGGPLYLQRLVSVEVAPTLVSAASSLTPAKSTASGTAFQQFLLQHGHQAAANRVSRYLAESPVGSSIELPGPVGERNVYEVHSRGRILALADTSFGLLIQLGAILATGNEAILLAEHPASRELARELTTLPDLVRQHVTWVTDWQQIGPLAAVLHEGNLESRRALVRQAASLDGPLVNVQSASAAGLEAGSEDYALQWLVAEVSVSTNTAAAGGNAKLMTIG